MMCFNMSAIIIITHMIINSINNNYVLSIPMVLHISIVNNAVYYFDYYDYGFVHY